MVTARTIVVRLINSGAIPPECEEIAVQELHQELVRRSRRICSMLAEAVSMNQFALHLAKLVG